MQPDPSAKGVWGNYLRQPLLPASKQIAALYLHIPFCHRICPYCSFYKHTPQGYSSSEFIDNLLQELRLQAENFQISPSSIYLGGGTPSMLSPKHLTRLMQGLDSQLGFSGVKEISMEANPKTFNADRAKLYADLGFNRISLGVQSFDAKLLKVLGREHTPASAVQAFHWLREVGFKCLNLDLMFSVPTQSLQSWQNTLQQAISLDPEHISCYNLNFEEDTAFFEALQQGLMQQDEQNDVEFFQLGRQMLQQHGYERYETSNYAKNAHYSLHNQSYWFGRNYLGLGPSAVSSVGLQRFSNIANTKIYNLKLAAAQLATSEREQLGMEEWRTERLALQLRTKEGVSVAYLHEHSRDLVEQLCRQGMAELDTFNLRLTAQGSLLVDEIVTRLL